MFLNTFSSLIRLLVLCSLTLPLSAQEAPRVPVKPKVDYRMPKRTYVEQKIDEWKLLVESSLHDNDAELEKKATRRLQEKLAAALKTLPTDTHARLIKLPIYLMHGPRSPLGGLDNGMEYFQKYAPIHFHHIDAAWKSCVVIYSAENYVQLDELWSVKALMHELAHAHHLEQWPEKQPEIFRAWDNASKRNLYRDRVDSDGRKIQLAYAMTNQLEYFAELSCMYFVGCNYAPKNRDELKAYDPEGYDMIEKMWGIKKR